LDVIPCVFGRLAVMMEVLLTLVTVGTMAAPIVWNPSQAMASRFGVSLPVR
jgi:hypothetical protein